MWKWEAEGQPKAVVAILHSAYEHHRWYAWLIEKLRTSGFHVVMGDLPGHGEQRRNLRYHNENFQDYYKHTKLLMNVAMDYNLPIFLIGQGLGATIAMRVLQKNQVECAGVILSSPWLHLQLQPGKLPNALSSLGALTANVKLKHTIPLEYLTRNVQARSEMKDEVPHNQVVTVQWYKDFQSMTKRLKATDGNFPNIPLLLMTAGKDQLADTVATKQWLMHQNLSEFHFKEWPECAHSLYFEVEREDIYAYTRDFIFNVLRSLGYIIN